MLYWYLSMSYAITDEKWGEFCKLLVLQELKSTFLESGSEILYVQVLLERSV